MNTCDVCGKQVKNLSATQRGRYGLDLCSAAHTLVLAGGRADWSAGAVIAADTDPEAAWRETQDQARGPWLALQRATGATR